MSKENEIKKEAMKEVERKKMEKLKQYINEKFPDSDFILFLNQEKTSATMIQGTMLDIAATICSAAHTDEQIKHIIKSSNFALSMSENAPKGFIEKLKEEENNG